MKYTNQAIKVGIKEEEYTATAEITICRLLVNVRITPDWYVEYEVFGRAKCSPDDTYDASIGRKISKARAVVKAYKKGYRYATDYQKRLFMYIDSYSRFQGKVSDVIYGNQKYLERMLRLNQAK